MLFTKKVRLNWYSSMNFFLERFGRFLTLKIHFESPKLALLTNCHQMKTQNLVISFDWPETLLFRTHTACYAKSQYSLLKLLIFWRNSKKLVKMQIGIGYIQSWCILASPCGAKSQQTMRSSPRIEEPASTLFLLCSGRARALAWIDVVWHSAACYEIRDGVLYYILTG